MAVSLLIASRVSHVASSRQQKDQFLGNCIIQRSTEGEAWLNEKEIKLALDRYVEGQDLKPMKSLNIRM
jgi:hypothetical protein